MQFSDYSELITCCPFYHIYLDTPSIRRGPQSVNASWNYEVSFVCIAVYSDLILWSVNLTTSDSIPELEYRQPPQIKINSNSLNSSIYITARENFVRLNNSLIRCQAFKEANGVISTTNFSTPAHFTVQGYVGSL